MIKLKNIKINIILSKIINKIDNKIKINYNPQIIIIQLNYNTIINAIKQ